jgi:tetratricopeptide (TPR) repeat protein
VARLVVDRLRAFWDFQDFDLSERNLRAQLEREPDDAGRAEVLTQLARVEGLRDDFDAGDRLLDEAEALGGESAVVAVRVLLERGRLRRSAGEPVSAFPLFVSAFDRAIAAGEGFIAGDAAHMAAICSDDVRDWTAVGLELAERDPDASYWRATLLNNLGWWHQERGEHDEALLAFQGALAARERYPEREFEIELAHYALAVALRSLGRRADALAHAEHAVAWADRTGADAPFMREELAALRSNDADA